MFSSQLDVVVLIFMVGWVLIFFVGQVIDWPERNVRIEYRDELAPAVYVLAGVPWTYLNIIWAIMALLKMLSVWWAWIAGPVVVTLALYGLAWLLEWWLERRDLEEAKNS